jgi:hypothetical protein
MWVMWASVVAVTVFLATRGAALRVDGAPSVADDDLSYVEFVTLGIDLRLFLAWGIAFVFVLLALVSFVLYTRERLYGRSFEKVAAEVVSVATPEASDVPLAIDVRRLDNLESLRVSRNLCLDYDEGDIVCVRVSPVEQGSFFERDQVRYVQSLGRVALVLGAFAVVVLAVALFVTVMR